jgi:hypothetical protein
VQSARSIARPAERQAGFSYSTIFFNWSERNRVRIVNDLWLFPLETALYFIVSNAIDRYDFRHMIKALLLIVDPVATWDGIVAAQRKWSVILVGYLLPLLILSSVAEGYGMTRWGKPRGDEMNYIKVYSKPEVLVFETAQLVLSLFIVFLGAKLIKSLGETFHGRHSFSQCFTVTVYGLSPLFLLRVPNAFSWMPLWLTWAIGISLSAAILYRGLPRVMRPDPPHALGLYLMSVLLLTIVTGLACFVTMWYLQGRFGRLDALLSRFIPASRP